MKKILFCLLVISSFMVGVLNAKTIKLKGASQFDNTHSYNKALITFGQLFKQCSVNKVKFRVKGNSTLGLEKDYLNFMNRGTSVDYAIVSPAHMATYSKKVTLMSMPFLFRDMDHWNRVLNSDVFKPMEKELAKKADVIIIGYAGGSTRNLITNVKVSKTADFPKVKLRVQGAPIHAKMFGALGFKPSVISYSEVYNAIQSNVVNGLENGASGLQKMKFYEVAKYIGLTRHTITVRPILFSGKVFRKLSKADQSCVKMAGKVAGEWGRTIESGGAQGILDDLLAKKLIKVSEISDYPMVLKKSLSVKEAYAKEVGALDLLKAINKM